MKKALIAPPVRTAALILLYLFGLVFWSLALNLFPIAQQRKHLLQIAQLTADRYTGDTGLTENISPDARRIVFDAAGNILFDETPALYWSFSVPDAYLQSMKAEILAGNDVFRLYYERDLNDLIVLAGRSVGESGGVGGAIAIRNMKNIPEATEGLALCYTVLYWVAAAVILTYARKKRRLDEAQRNYIANVTHALKAPIAAVQALTEALSDTVPPDSDQQRIYYGMILQETSAQSRMVQEILTLSRLQSGGAEVPRTEVNPAALLVRVRERYGPLCDCVGISFVISDAAMGLPPLNTNEDYLFQIFEILLENALKFTDEGGEIRIDAAVFGRRATFEVRDDGAGISKEDLPQIFQRFYKGGGLHNDSGSGLGLAIAKELADQLKETIRAESGPDGGASFYFTARLK